MISWEFIVELFTFIKEFYNLSEIYYSERNLVAVELNQ